MPRPLDANLGQLAERPESLLWAVRFGGAGLPSGFGLLALGLQPATQQPQQQVVHAPALQLVLGFQQSRQVLVDRFVEAKEFHGHLRLKRPGMAALRQICATPDWLQAQVPQRQRVLQRGRRWPGFGSSSQGWNFGGTRATSGQWRGFALRPEMVRVLPIHSDRSLGFAPEIFGDSS
jgi:hypothetical protein